MTIMESFETERLRFRPLEPGDFEDLYALYRDPDVMRYIPGDPRDRQETQAALDRHLADHQRFGYGLCAAIDKSDGKMVGRCGLIPWKDEGPWQAELAWLFVPAVWGRGLGTEFGRVMLIQAWGPLGLDHLVARSFLANAASVNIMRQLGMHLARTLPNEVYYEVRRVSASRAGS